MATEPNIKSDTSEVCAGCKKSPTSLSQALKRCARCKEVFYCSRECQKTDWKSHKKSCNKTPRRPSLSGDGIDLGGNGFDAFSYYNTVAHTIPAARELAKKLNISLPTGGDGEQGMAVPMRCLITTGLDTLENLRLLFGPSWQPDSDYEKERLNVLIRPPPGSPSYVMYSVLDNISPSLPWSPRPADETETKKLQEVRDMQDLIRRHLADRKQPTAMDMQCILQSFGEKWSEKLAVYQTAVNAMDQGVEPIRRE